MPRRPPASCCSTARAIDEDPERPAAMRADEQAYPRAPSRHDFARRTVQDLVQHGAGARAELGRRTRHARDHAATYAQGVVERRHDFVDEIVALEAAFGGSTRFEIDARAEEQPDHFRPGEVDVRGA